MATKTQILFMEGELKIHAQFVDVLNHLEGAACRAYGGRKKLDANLNYHKGQRAAYARLCRLAQDSKF